MSSVNKILKFYKDEMEIKKTVLTNIIKMLTARKLLNENDIKNNIENITKQKSDNNIFVIKLKDKTNLKIKISHQKITSVNKSSSLYTFFDENKDNDAILVVKEINTKAKKQLKKNYSKLEVFNEKFLLQNIIDHVLVPKHEVIDSKKFFDERPNIHPKNLPKMNVMDPISLYYKMKIGDVVRIERPSESSGIVSSYRIVTNAINK